MKRRFDWMSPLEIEDALDEVLHALERLLDYVEASDEVYGYKTAPEIANARNVIKKWEIE